jgi:hypothetical protein
LVGLTLATISTAVPWLSDTVGYKPATKVDVFVFEDVFLAATALLLAWCMGTAFTAAWRATPLAGSVLLLAVAAIGAARLHGLVRFEELSATPWHGGLDLVTGAVVVLALAVAIAPATRPIPDPLNRSAASARVLGLMDQNPSAVPMAAFVAVLAAALLTRIAFALIPAVVLAVVGVLAVTIRELIAGGGKQREHPGPARSPVRSGFQVVAGLALITSAGLLIASLLRPWAAWDDSPDIIYDSPVYLPLMYGPLGLIAVLLVTVAIGRTAAMILRGRQVPTVAMLSGLLGTIIATATIPITTASESGPKMHALGAVDLFVGSFTALAVAFVISQLNHRHHRAQRERSRRVPPRLEAEMAYDRYRS